MKKYYNINSDNNGYNHNYGRSMIMVIMVKDFQNNMHVSLTSEI